MSELEITNVLQEQTSTKKEFADELIEKFQTLHINKGAGAGGKNTNVNGKSFEELTNIENKLFIINHEINEAYFTLQLKVKNDFEIRYHQLRQFLIVVILFALFLSFINLFKALRVSSE